MTKVEEIWRPVKDYEGLYEVSNLGRVRSLDRHVPNTRYPSYNIFRKGVILKPGIHTHGYIRFQLGKLNGKYAHRLVAHTFIPNPENLKEVNHKDGNKKNNSVDNLEWCTRQENQIHAGKTGLMARGEKVAGSWLTKELALEVYNAKGKQKDIAIKYGLNKVHVGKIKRKEIWKHIH